MDEPPFALVCGWRYPLLIIAKGGSFSTVSTLRLFSSTSIACGFLYERQWASAQRRCPLLHIKTTAFIHNRSYNLMIDKFSQVAENLPAADRDADRQYHVINGYPVVFSFSKEPNPEAFERIRNILLATSYTKKVG